jgi:23S rRNA-/tRNA-specific pseudouridylate synthase
MICCAPLLLILLLLSMIWSFNIYEALMVGRSYRLLSIKVGSQDQPSHRSMTTAWLHRNPFFTIEMSFEQSSHSESSIVAFLLNRIPSVDNASSLSSSTSSIKRSIRRGLVYINEEKANTTSNVSFGAVVQVFKRNQPMRSNQHLDLTSMDSCQISTPATVLFEDNHLAVVVKPPNMPLFTGSKTQYSSLINTTDNLTTHPQNNSRETTLQKLLAYTLIPSKSSNPLRIPQLVHRLDKATGGLMVVAKTYPALRKLSSMFANREVDKKYRAIVFGRIDCDGIVNKLISGKEAFTCYSPDIITSGSSYEHVTTIDVDLHSGRKHQIRR